MQIRRRGAKRPTPWFSKAMRYGSSTDGLIDSALRKILHYHFTGLLLAVLCFTISGVQARSSNMPLQPVASFNMPRFMGA